MSLLAVVQPWEGGEGLEYQGHRLEALGRTADALAAYRKSMVTLEPFLDSRNVSVNSQYLTDEENIALMNASDGEKTEALKLASHALEHAKNLSNESARADRETVILANAWSTMAIVQSSVGTADQSKQSAVTAMGLWDAIRTPTLLVPFRQIIARTRSLVGE